MYTPKRKVAQVKQVDKTFLSTSELRSYLDCSDEFIETLRNTAQLSFFRIGRKIWYKKEEVDNLIMRSKVI